MKRLLASLFIVASLGIARAGDMTVSLDDMLLLSQRGVSDETILVFLQSREIGFIPNADDIDRLLQAGVSEAVIRSLLQQTAAATPVFTSAAPVFTSSSSYPERVYASPYPSYYYTPYYSGLPFYSYNAYYRYGGGHKHHKGGHDDRPHHSGSLQLAHNDHGVSRISHGSKHGVTHIGGHDSGHRISSAGHSTFRAGHSIASAGHSRSGSIGHGSRSTGGHGRSGGFGRRGGHSGGH